MTPIPPLHDRLREAVSHFWMTRGSQSERQGVAAGTRDAGQRTAVTGGAQMDGLVNLVRDLLCEHGASRTSIHCEKSLELPGWYRPEKQWDLIVVAEGQLIAGLEFKSHIGPSFGNNFNNRTEEALGSAADIWAAYREGAFAPALRPWLGYLMLLEETPRSTANVRAREPHFSVFPEFKSASYAERYRLLLLKMVRERLYDAACLLLTSAQPTMTVREPSPELSFSGFVNSLLARVAANAPRPL